jgi:hypothetical protein
MSSSLKDWWKGRIDLVEIYNEAIHSTNFTPPTVLIPSTGGGYVTLDWVLPELGLVRGYNVYRNVNGQIDWRCNTDGLWTETQFTDLSPYPGTNCYWVRAVNARGVEGISTQVVCIEFGSDEVPSDAGPPAARGLALHVAPNPFNPTTRAFFNLERPGDARLVLHDVAGRRVRSWKFERLPAGPHAVPIAVEERGSRLASGVYFLTIEAGGEHQQTRIVLLK